MRGGPPREAGLATVMTVRRGTQHHRTPVGSVRSQRAERGRFRAKAGPPAHVGVSFPQDSTGRGGGCVGRRLVRGDAIFARVLLVPVGDVQSLEGGLHSELVFAQVRSGFV